MVMDEEGYRRNEFEERDRIHKQVLSKIERQQKIIDTYHAALREIMIDCEAPAADIARRALEKHDV